MFDQKLVEHCSAVLAGLKTANLFSYTVDPATTSGSWSLTGTGL